MRISPKMARYGAFVVMAVIALTSVERVTASADPELSLGRALFEDKNLSADRSVACASCHLQGHAFADIRPVSVGSQRHRGTRNAPSLLGLADYRSLFWDGRAEDLVDQVSFPLFSPAEMGLSGESQLLERVRQNPRYVREFERSMGIQESKLRTSDIAHAIAVYERSLARPSSSYDKFLEGNSGALSAEAAAGLALFRGKAGCSSCHLVSDHDAPFTDNSFHESAVGMHGAGAKFPRIAVKLAGLPLQKRLDLVSTDPQVAALGRFVVTLDPKDIGAFRTPSLRAARDTGPYMHDGSVATLQEAVDIELYYRGLKQGYPVNLSLAERREIRLFIESASASSSAVQGNSGIGIHHE